MTAERRGLVRPARPDDAPAMAEVHVRAWQAAYRGLIADDFLDALDVDERSARWRQSLLEGGHPSHRGSQPVPLRHYVVEDATGRVVGISTIGAARRPDEAGLGELWMINLHPDAWGLGYGSRLLEAVTAELRRDGYGEAVLWVAEENPRARRFYEVAGWTPDGTRADQEAGGVVMAEVRYRREL